MKSEERHKLHHNALADWLANVYATIKPYQNAILGAAIVVLLAVLITMWWTNQSTAKMEKAWTGLFTAINTNNFQELARVADDYSNSPVAAVAILIVADLKRNQGSNLLFINKAAADQELNQTQKLYQLVLSQTKSDSLRAQATFGLAQVLEALVQLDSPEGESLGIELEERTSAVIEYQRIITNWPDTTYARMAEQRLQDLKRLSTREMYDRFAQFDPKPAFSQQPGQQQPGQQPPGQQASEQPQSDLNKMPEEGPIAPPGPSAEQKPEEKNVPAPEANPDQISPEKPTEKPADAQPAPAAEKPAQ